MKHRIIFPLSMSILWGTVFASAMHNWTFGLCMGLLMGLAFGLFGDEGGDHDE